jgi:fructose-1,6-bisphosphatase/inositol monophosphatase family enzyme
MKVQSDILPNVVEILELVKQIAIEAGELITHVWGTNKPFDCKDGKSNDLVTQTDKKVEQFIFSKLRAHFPDHKFLGEESDGDKCELGDELTWVVDPIDGTTNFVHNLGNLAISIALCINKREIIGVIYNPIQREIFYARSGDDAAAYLHDCNSGCTRMLKTSSTVDLKKALICTEFGAAYGDCQKVDEKWSTQMRPLLLHPVHGIRQLGAATMNMMAVARGSAEAYIESGLKAWDMAAGELIVRQAGGTVSAIDNGTEFSLTGAQLIAGANSEIHNRVRQVITGEP